MRRAIGLLLLVAVLTMAAVIAIVVATRPTGNGDTIAKGQPVPNVAGTTLDGQPFDLASLRGRPVVINFWGPSCVPCRTEFPLLAAKARQHEADGLLIVGVLTDDGPEGARDFVGQYGATWPTVIDPGAAIKSAYHVIARPQSYFVDRTGILRSIQIGEVRDADFERQYAAISGGS
ncbi:MAG TPA: TlpA disulfide reductase family protein [Candidatus Limnocylindrales bacterium]|nr:TlpA disulfide reductase family protein [Candidatus Limnocylindrales bacterium]